MTEAESYRFDVSGFIIPSGAMPPGVFHEAVGDISNLQVAGENQRPVASPTPR